MSAWLFALHSQPRTIHIIKPFFLCTLAFPWCHLWNSFILSQWVWRELQLPAGVRVSRDKERVRRQEDRIIDSVRTEFICPQLPTAGCRVPLHWRSMQPWNSQCVVLYRMIKVLTLTATGAFILWHALYVMMTRLPELLGTVLRWICWILGCIWLCVSWFWHEMSKVTNVPDAAISKLMAAG